MKTYLRIFLILVLALMIIGAVMVFSASGTYSAMRFNNLYVLFKSHLWKIIAALALMVIFSIIPYEYYRKYSKYMLIVMIGLLIATFIFAPKVKGAARWIDLGLFSFQPSELAKLVLMMHLAYMIERKEEVLKNFKDGFAYTLIWIFAVSGLVLIQPNVSTALIIVMTAFTILYIGGARAKHIVFTLFTTAVAAGIVMMMFTHSRERILTFIGSFHNGGEINMQVKQAKIALGSGGFFGLGLGHSRQSDLFLPESYGDFIFSILGEELGFLGSVLVLSGFLALFLIGIIIAKKAKDRFGQLLAFGLVFNIIISAFINAAVVTGIFPTTGITLPFISFGGTSIILFGISVGIIINIARQVQKTEEVKPALENA